MYAIRSYYDIRVKKLGAYNYFLAGLPERHASTGLRHFIFYCVQNFSDLALSYELFYKFLPDRGSSVSAADHSPDANYVGAYPRNNFV